MRLDVFRRYSEICVYFKGIVMIEVIYVNGRRIA